MSNSVEVRTTHNANNFDLLRLLFACMVLVSHSFELVDGNRSREPLTSIFHTISFGEVGVDCFFILSGMLISTSWLRSPSLWEFLKKRVLRIYPGFVVAYLVSVLVVGAIGSVDASQYFHEMGPRHLIFQLGTLATPTTPPTFQSYPYPLVNGSLWTVHYEFICYLMIMCLGLVAVLQRPKVMVGVFVASLVLMMVASLASAPPLLKSAEIWIRFIPMFLSGAVITSARLSRHITPAKTFAAVVLLLAGMCFQITAGPAVATAGAYVLLAAGFATRKPRFLKNLPDISYGVYLYGWPVQMLLLAFGATQPILIFAASVIGCVVLGCISWYLVEKPMLKLKSVGPARNLPIPSQAS